MSVTKYLNLSQCKQKDAKTGDDVSFLEIPLSEFLKIVDDIRYGKIKQNYMIISDNEWR